MKKNGMRLRIAPVTWLLLVALAGCSREAGTGSASLSVATQGLAASSVTRVQLTVSGPHIPADITYELVQTGGRWSGTISGIPAGDNRTFHAEAFDAADVLIYEGTTTGITITRGTTTVLVMLLQDVVPTDPFVNTAPFIDALMASSNGVASERTPS